MNPSTTILQGTRTITFNGEQSRRCPNELFERYDRLLNTQYIGWTEHLRFRRLLGRGGQGLVYLTDRRGSDGFTLPVALKVFSPERFSCQLSYDRAMERIAEVASCVAKIQHDNLLDVQNFTERSRIRVMEMEWVDGYDLNDLLTPAMLSRVQSSTTARMRKRREGANVSETKSRLQRAFGEADAGIGFLDPIARLRPFRLRTVRRSSL